MDSVTISNDPNLTTLMAPLSNIAQTTHGIDQNQTIGFAIHHGYFLADPSTIANLSVLMFVIGALSAVAAIFVFNAVKNSITIKTYMMYFKNHMGGRR